MFNIQENCEGGGLRRAQDHLERCAEIKKMANSQASKTRESER